MLVISSWTAAGRLSARTWRSGWGDGQSQLGAPTLSECIHEAEGGPEKSKEEERNTSKFSSVLRSSAAPGGTELHNTMGFNKMPLTHKVCLPPAP